MFRRGLLVAGFLPLVLATIIRSGPVSGPMSGAVALQPTTPGTPQTGNVNITGTVTSLRAPLKILAIGDSHTNGAIPPGVVLTGLQSPLDRQWGASPWQASNAVIVGQYVQTAAGNHYRVITAGTSTTGTGPSGTGSDIADGTAHWAYVSPATWSPWYRADSQLTPDLGTTDPNTSMGVGAGSFLGWIPDLLRASYPTLGTIDVANGGVGGASAFTWAGECANGYFAGLLAPNDADTVTVCGQVYTFKTTPAAPFDLTIGTATGSVLNLCNAINAESTGWFAGTTANANCFCPNPASTTYGHAFALTPGTAGNALTIASSNTLRVTAVDGGLTPGPSFVLANGSATSALWANTQTRLTAGAGFGVPDVVLITLGTNDAARAGDRGRSFAASLSTLDATIHSLYPSAKIILWRPITTGAGAVVLTALKNVVVPAVDAEVAAHPAYVSSIDVFSLGIGGTGDVAILNSGGVHATAYGYSVVAQLFAAKIASVLGLK